ncbi:MAG TPA: hypothetical protein PKW69_14345 [Niabella sp.]|nr:hypothetical protein [Niabella sp.]
MATARDNIFRRIREALTQPTDLPFPKSEGNSSVFQPLNQEIEVEFAERFTALQGKFAFCLNKAELRKQFNNLIAQEKWDKIYCVEPDICKLLGEAVNVSGDEQELASCDVPVPAVL